MLLKSRVGVRTCVRRGCILHTRILEYRIPRPDWIYYGRYSRQGSKQGLEVDPGGRTEPVGFGWCRLSRPIEGGSKRLLGYYDKRKKRTVTGLRSPSLWKHRTP
jgi:hypothetical protein